MSKNLISIEIPPAVLEEMTGHAQALLALLKPYASALTSEERKTRLKMADKSVAFVAKTLQYAESHPQFAPQHMKVADLNIDVKAVEDLTSVAQPVDMAASLLSDTIMLAGSEAFMVALMYYNAVKRAAEDGEPGAKAIYEDLKIRFEGNGKRKAKAPVAA